MFPNVQTQRSTLKNDEKKHQVESKPYIPLFSFSKTITCPNFWIADEYKIIFDRGRGSDEIEDAQGFPFLAHVITGEIRFLPAKNGVDLDQIKIERHSKMDEINSEIKSINEILLDRFNNPFEKFMCSSAPLGGTTGNVHQDLAIYVGWRSELALGYLFGGGVFKGKTFKIHSFRANSLNANGNSCIYDKLLLNKVEIEYKDTPVPSGLTTHTDRLERVLPNEISQKIKNCLIKELKKSSEQEFDEVQFDLSENKFEEKWRGELTPLMKPTLGQLIHLYPNTLSGAMKEYVQSINGDKTPFLEFLTIIIDKFDKFKEDYFKYGDNDLAHLGWLIKEKNYSLKLDLSANKSKDSTYKIISFINKTPLEKIKIITPNALITLYIEIYSSIRKLKLQGFYVREIENCGLQMSKAIKDCDLNLFDQRMKDLTMLYVAQCKYFSVTESASLIEKLVESGASFLNICFKLLNGKDLYVSFLKNQFTENFYFDFMAGHINALEFLESSLTPYNKIFLMLLLALDQFRTKTDSYFTKKYDMVYEKTLLKTVSDQYFNFEAFVMLVNHHRWAHFNNKIFVELFLREILSGSNFLEDRAQMIGILIKKTKFYPTILLIGGRNFFKNKNMETIIRFYKRNQFAIKKNQQPNLFGPPLESKSHSLTKGIYSEHIEKTLDDVLHILTNDLNAALWKEHALSCDSGYFSLNIGMWVPRPEFIPKTILGERIKIANLRDNANSMKISSTYELEYTLSQQLLAVKNTMLSEDFVTLKALYQKAVKNFQEKIASIHMPNNLKCG